jgi:C1A family cysteine protease
MPQDYSKYRTDGCLLEETPSAAPMLKVGNVNEMPERIDLRGLCSPVENQGHVGSCAANAVVGALEYHQRLSGQSQTDLSRLYVYYNSRKIGGTTATDSGTFIHHVMASVLAFGACPERMWPYQQAMWATEPIKACYQGAEQFGAVSYARTGSGLGAKAAVANGLPVVFGISLPEDMLMREAAETGQIASPRGGWPQPSGGHAMLIVGYDDARASWLVRNSWGSEWGEQGHLWIAYDVMEYYSHPHAFWTIGAIESRTNLSVSGPSQQQALAAVRAEAPAQMTHALSNLKRNLGADLESSLEQSKRGIRERLRGPGAGGGY